MANTAFLAVALPPKSRPGLPAAAWAAHTTLTAATTTSRLRPTSATRRPCRCPSGLKSPTSMRALITCSTVETAATGGGCKITSPAVGCAGRTTRTFASTTKPWWVIPSTGAVIGSATIHGTTSPSPPTPPPARLIWTANWSILDRGWIQASVQTCTSAPGTPTLATFLASSMTSARLPQSPFRQ